MKRNPIDRLLIPLAVLLLAGGAITAAMSSRPWLARQDVVQPIAFSHRIHAGLNKIPCLYCHSTARVSEFSVAPAVQKCVGCHGNVGIRTGALQAVTQPWTDHDPQPLEIQWNRVNQLPDFVRFNHRPHIRAGVACQSCHGLVETMDRIVPVYQINMGFCLNCHTQRNVSIDCVVCHH